MTETVRQTKKWALEPDYIEVRRINDWLYGYRRWKAQYPQCGFRRLTKEEVEEQRSKAYAYLA